MPRSKSTRPEVSSPALTQPVERIERQGFAVGRDGTPIYYRTAGVKAAPVVVLSDGVGCDGYIWKYIQPELEKRYRVVHWHYRGHGRTPPPRDVRNVAIADLADDLVCVLDAAAGDEDRAVLVAHSMGVQVSLEVFRRHRARCRGLALLCGSYGTPLRTFKGKQTLEQALPWIKFTAYRMPGIITSLWQKLLPTEVAYQVATMFEVNGELIRREDFFPYLDHLARVDPLIYLEMLAAAGRHSAKEVLAQIDVPTLVIAGDRDGFTPVGLSQEMHEQIKDSQLLVIPGGTHTTPIEHPLEITRAVADFMTHAAPV